MLLMSFRSCCRISGLLYLLFGMICTTGLLEWMAIDSLEGIGLKGEVIMCIRECFGCLESNDGDDCVECLWLRIGRNFNQADSMMKVC